MESVREGGQSVFLSMNWGVKCSKIMIMSKIKSKKSNLLAEFRG
jgi:hypothetical protein